MRTQRSRLSTSASMFTVAAMALMAACSDGATTATLSTTEPDTERTSSTVPTFDTTRADDSTQPDTTQPETTQPDTTRPSTTVANSAPACATADARSCLLPWPNNALTVADPSTPTGLRLALRRDVMPRNAAGTYIDVTDQNRADGFSPGSAILIDVPGIDFEASGLAPSTDIGRSQDDGSPIIITDTAGGAPWPYWAEVDAQATSAADSLLMVHPAIALVEGHTYRVQIHDLVDTQGVDVTPDITDWMFTVASAESLSGRMLHIRNDAYAQLGDLPPSFSIETVDDNGDLRTVEGTINVPNYLSGDGSPGSRFVLGDDGLPMPNLTVTSYPAKFRCVLPLNAVAPVPTIVYGHGLLGGRGEVDGLSFAASAGLAAACATDWIGMATDDIDNFLHILGDLSNFSEAADRLQQGILNFQFLGRALNDERAFATSSAFDHDDGTPIIAPGMTQFVGNSQGGILGGAASAVSTEWQRAVLGVPGIVYALLLPRSSDWPQFQALFDAAYEGPVDRVLSLQLIQLLWDRGENDGYVQHLAADPYDGIAAKDVLIVEAFGDHQVANVSTEIFARTIRAKTHQPVVAPGRSNDVVPHWGIDPIDTDTAPVPAIVLWDFGTPAPPAVNLPPTEPEYGADPHGAGSREPLVLQQALTFLLTGDVTDVCAGKPCVSRVLTG